MALQAGDRRHALAVLAQPQGAPGFAQRSLQGLVDRQRCQCLQLSDLRLQGLLGHTKGQQWLPMPRQLQQGVAHLLLRRWAGHQLAKGQVALELAQVDQLIELAAQRLQAVEQLALVIGTHREELAGRLVASDARHGLGLFEQLRWGADPLADVVAALQLPQPGHTEHQQQTEQHDAGHFAQQALAQVGQGLGHAQRPGEGRRSMCCNSAGNRQTAHR